MPILGVIASSDRNVPSAPTIGTATDVGTGRAYNNGAATVTFTAPTYTGGLPITSYTVTSSPGGFTGAGASSPITVTGLQSSVAYTFTVTATNSAGTSAASSASNSITATTVPQAPTIGTATDGGTGTTVSVAFTGNATGGKAISTYTATSSPGSITGTSASSPITVSGLTTGQAYTFTVTATNANGTSTASAASNSVTPASPSSFESISSATGSGTSVITISSIPTTYKMLQIRIFGHVDTGSDSGMWLTFNGAGNTTISNQTFDIRKTTVSTFSQTTSSGNGFYIRNYGKTAYGAPTIINIYDYANTSKFKTFDCINGFVDGVLVNDSDWNYKVGTYISTNAVTSITLTAQSGNFRSTNSVAIYGIK